MRGGFYSRLAMTGIRRNKQLYFPYLVTCAVMVMLSYIICYLSQPAVVKSLKVGSGTLEQILTFGQWVMAIFSLIFLFYTNSFLMRRRNREFGLYSILGMNKGNIIKILLWETLLIAIISLVAGLALGILLSKLVEAALARLMGTVADFGMLISPAAILWTAATFAAIFLLIALFSLARIQLSKPLSLLRSETVGEKPLKANWVLAVLSVGALIFAYYTAANWADPTSAILWFLVDVIIVIVATYLLFLAGSVALCRLLQKNKRYYYKPNHFVSVASMAYRMKRNGAGLASICVLSTMVLVTVTATTTLYTGIDSSIREVYPWDISVWASADTPADVTGENLQLLSSGIEDVVGDNADTYTECWLYTCTLWERDGVLYTNYQLEDGYNYQLYQARVLSLADYNRITGHSVTLEARECLVYSIGDDSYDSDTVEIPGVDTLTVKERPATFPELRDYVYNYESYTCLYLVVPDLMAYTDQIYTYELTTDTYDGYGSYRYYCLFNFATALSSQEQLNIQDGIYAELAQIWPGSASIESKAEVRLEFLEFYGSLFAVGILLSVVFLFAAVLIIFYKQISEGYEDSARFGIMQKVGMTGREIRRSINSQLLTVFFAPLLLSGLHLFFALCLLWPLMQMNGITNRPLVLAVSGLCYLVYALFYGIVYKITSVSYYKIVSASA